MRTPSSATAAIVLAVGIGASFPAEATFVTLQPGPEGNDVNIVGGAHANQNFDAGVSGSKSWLMQNFGGVASVGLVRFDLAQIAGSSVASASLRLYQSDNFDPGATYSVYRVDSAWSESSVTYNSMPVRGDLVGSLVLPLSDINSGPGGTPVRQAFRTWDVTGLVQDWLGGSHANYGIWLQRERAVGDRSPNLYFAASDWPNEPGGFPSDVYGTQYRPALIVEAYGGPFPTQVPVPAALPLMMGGLAVLHLAGLRRRRYAC